MQAVARFMYVSDTQFEHDWSANFGQSAPAFPQLPKRATKGSAGYDFYSPIDFTLAPGETILLPTGVRARIAEGWALLLYPRSGLGFKYRLQLNNTVGVIDADYFNAKNEGHIMLKLTNDSKDGKTLSVRSGEAVCQGIFTPFGVTEDDDADGERTGGFGSTTQRRL